MMEPEVNSSIQVDPMIDPAELNQGSNLLQNNTQVDNLQTPLPNKPIIKKYQVHNRIN